VDAGVFYPAEMAHYRYFDQHPGQPYCRAVVGPKVAKLQQYFIHLVKETSGT
jgi:peptide-methionine (S)-S-oxide reductase